MTLEGLREARRLLEAVWQRVNAPRGLLKHDDLEAINEIATRIDKDGELSVADAVLLRKIRELSSREASKRALSKDHLKAFLDFIDRQIAARPQAAQAPEEPKAGHEPEAEAEAAQAPAAATPPAAEASPAAVPPAPSVSEKKPKSTTDKNGSAETMEAARKINLDHLFKLTAAAAKKVPGGKWVFGPIALASAGAIVLAVYYGSARLALFGTTTTFIFAVLFYGFVAGTRRKQTLTGPFTFLVWSVSLLFILVLGTIYSCVFWARPLDLSPWIRGEQRSAAKDPTDAGAAASVPAADASISTPDSGGPDAEPAAYVVFTLKSIRFLDGAVHPPVRATIVVNDTTFSYPSNGVWTDVGPGLQPKAVHIPEHSSGGYNIQMTLLERGGDAGLESTDGYDLIKTFPPDGRHWQSQQDVVEQPFPIGGVYKLYEVSASGVRSAKPAAEILYSLSAGKTAWSWKDVGWADQRVVGEWDESEQSGLHFSVTSDGTGIHYTLRRPGPPPKVEHGVLQVGAGWLLRFPDGGGRHVCVSAQLLTGSDSDGSPTELRWAHEAPSIHAGTNAETCEISAVWATSFDRQ
jgi:hypothetical protein